MKSEELKICHRCKSKPIVTYSEALLYPHRTEWEVYCTKCNNAVQGYSARGKAIKGWNKIHGESDAK